MDRELAKNLLEACGNNLEMAVNMHIGIALRVVVFLQLSYLVKDLRKVFKPVIYIFAAEKRPEILF